jgi:lactoylglutathione lyase
MKESVMNIGHLEICLNVKDLRRSLDFYHKIGYEDVSVFLKDKWAILRYRENILGLYEGHIQENCLNFRGGNITKLIEEFDNLGIPFESVPVFNDDGSGSAFLRDPDGNLLFFDTAPEELEELDEN